MLQLRRLLLARTEWFELAVRRHAVADGLGHITPAMHRLFAHMGYKPVKLSHLVEVLAVSRQAVHRLVRDACELGVVELVDDPNDRRAKMVRFTEAGLPWVANAIRAQQAVEAELVRRIGRRNVEKLAQVLDMDWGESPEVQRAAPADPS